ncbi:hypothetical protein Lepto7375DRAFT_4217 [Leptolyngbya sp. PCC 7375]|nr:hypothetical protein Lepto7375DRAFT_4217 [Leptolyngbya sp. PCC 7375]
MYTSFLATPALIAGTPSPESALQLYSVPKPDREPVKILIIGSQVAVNTIIHSLHHHRFAEPYSPRGMR